MPRSPVLASIIAVAVVVTAAPARAEPHEVDPFIGTGTLELQVSASAGLVFVCPFCSFSTSDFLLAGAVSLTYEYELLSGACCLPDGSCLDVNGVSTCDAQGGLFLGPGTTCANEACPPPPTPGSICLESGIEAQTESFSIPLSPGFTSLTLDQFDDQGGTRILRKVTVEFEASPQISYTVENETPFVVETAVEFIGFVSTSFVVELPPLLFNEPAPGAILAPSDGVPGSGPDYFDGGLIALELSSSTEFGEGLPQGACFLPDGSCQTLPCGPCASIGGTFDDSVSCPPLPGACCFLDGSCTDALLTGCLDAGGTFSGEGSACADVSCPQPGALRRWQPAGGAGAFGDPMNWDPNVVPGVGCPEEGCQVLFDHATRSVAEIGAGISAAGQVFVIDGDLTLAFLNGSGLELERSPGLVIGTDPERVPTLTLTGDGMIGTTSIQIGRGPATSAELQVFGPSLEVIGDENLCVGCQGTGILSILHGGFVFARDVVIGEPGQPGSIVNVDNGTLEVALLLSIENGRLIVGPAGTVSTGFGLFVGQNGSVTGGGLIEGPVINLGAIEVGGGQILALDGNFDQLGEIPQLGSLAGSLRSAVNDGAGPADTFGRLSVLGTATLGGGLVLDAANATEIPLGEVNAVLDAATLSGTFDVVSLAGFGADKVVSLDYPEGVAGGGQVTVVVNAVNSVFDYESSDNDIVDGTPTDVAVADLDLDGDTDLVVAVANDDDAMPGAVVILENQGTQPDGTWNGYLLREPIAVGRVPSAIAVGSFDLLDTLPDLAVANAGDDTITLLGNDGGLDFSSRGPALATAETPLDVVAHDIDGDGEDDLAVAGFGDDTVRVLVRSGDFDFIEVAALAAPGGPCALDPEDLENDRDTDLVIGLCIGNEVRVRRQVGGGGGSEWELAEIFPVGDDPRSLGIADLDGNGFGDIVTANAGDGSLSVLRNFGSAGFNPAVAVDGADDPRSLVFADLDGDGDDDLAYTAVMDGARVLLTRRNDSESAATGIILAEELQEDENLDNPVFVAAADVDADGTPDLVTVSEPDGAGPGRPGGATTLLGLPALVPGDVTGDGLVDFADLVAVLAAWGPCVECPEDLDGDGVVGLLDLLAVLSNWSA